MGSDEELAKIIAYASVQGERQIERRIRWVINFFTTLSMFFLKIPFYSDVSWIGLTMSTTLLCL